MSPLKILIPILFVVGLLGLWLLSTTLLGKTRTGTFTSITEAPRMDKFPEFKAAGPVNYHIHKQWDRTLVFLSGTAPLSSLEDFTSKHKMSLYTNRCLTSDLINMTLAYDVDTNKIATGFSEADAFADSNSPVIGKKTLLWYRYRDGRFTLLFHD